MFEEAVFLPRGRTHSAERGHSWRRCLRVAVLAPILSAVMLGTVATGAAFATGSTTVTGSVTAPSAAAAGHVAVYLWGEDGSEQGIATKTTSGDTATYTFTNVAAGTYAVWFYDSTPADNVAPMYYGGGQSLSGATEVTVPATGTVTLNPTTLATGGTISGTVTDQNPSTDLSNSRVIACPVGDVGPVGCFEGLYASDITAGAYSLAGLAPGTYRVLYEPETSTDEPVYTDSGAGIESGAGGIVYVDGGGITASKDAATLFTVAGGSSASESFTAPQAGGMTGTVTQTGGGPVAAGLVALYSSAGEQISITTITAGTYTFTGLVPGAYKVGFAAVSEESLSIYGSNLAPQFSGGANTLASAATETVNPGLVTPNVNAALPIGGTVSGKVTAAQGGAPLAGIEIRLVDADGNSAFAAEDQIFSLYDLIFGGGSSLINATFTTSPDGTYTITGVPPGTWYVEFVGGAADNGTYYQSEYYRGKFALGGSTPITVSAGQTVTGINEALLQQSPTAPGMPTVSHGALSGLAKDKVALKFSIAAGAGVAPDLDSFSVKLPKGFSWARSKLAKDLSLGGVAFSYGISAGRLVVTFKAGERAAALSITAGGITVTKAIEKAAGGSPKTKKGTKAKRGRDKIKSETISLLTTDSIDGVSPLSFTVKKPH